MNDIPVAGLGTLVRHLLALLDGDVQALYDEAGVAFRPRFYPIVQNLLRNGPSSVTALAQASGVSQPAMTQTLSEMRQLNLITFSAGEDPRQKLFRLTAEGERLAEQLRPTWRARAAAAAELDLEIPCPLSATLAAAIEALERKPFKVRIQEKMTK